MTVPESLAVLVRKIIRDIFLERKRQPTLDLIYERIVQGTDKVAEHLNLFDGPNIPAAKVPYGFGQYLFFIDLCHLFALFTLIKYHTKSIYVTEKILSKYAMTA